MQRLGTILAVLVLSGGVALAQGGSGGGGAGGSAGGASAGSGAGTAGTTGPTSGTTGTNATSQSGSGSSAMPGAQVNGPNNTGGPVPGLSTPSPADSSTVGRAPGVNPANSQDATRRGNPSDRTLPAARNPQDMKLDSTGTPQIIKPER
jgi:hypothetical protein